jgi:phage terminase small subunit
MAKLTAKQTAFCKHYVSNGLNGTQACISAGYKEKHARVQAVENLAKPNIADYVQKLQSGTAKKLQITRESQLNDLEWAKEAAKNNFELAPYMKAVEIQNKMLGLNEPDTLNVNQYTATVEFADR